MKDFEIIQSVKMLTMSFPSSMAHIDKAVKHTSDFVISLNKTIDTFGLKLVLSEGITNAVVHGNKEDENKEVHLKLTLTASDITITIKDLGEGFLWKNQVTDEDALSDPEALSGRGLALIKAYGYDVTFNKNGNILYISKKFDDLPAGTAGASPHA